MPQLTLEYSADLFSTEQARELALALHRTLEPVLDAELDSFKTRVTPLNTLVIGDGDACHRMVHIEVAILSGRLPTVKQSAGEAALSLARRYVVPPAGADLQITVEIRDLDHSNYHKIVLAKARNSKALLHAGNEVTSTVRHEADAASVA